MLDEDLISLIAKNLLERGDLNSVRKLYSVSKAWSHGAFLAIKEFCSAIEKAAKGLEENRLCVIRY